MSNEQQEIDNMIVDVFFDDKIPLGELTVRQVRGITQELFEECYSISLHSGIKQFFFKRIEELKAKVKIKTKYAYNDWDEPLLLEAYLAAAEESVFGRNVIKLISLDMLDMLLPTKKTGKRGWWRVLESEQETITVKGYRFVPKKPTGKHGEGFLKKIDRRKDKNAKEHTYSIRDKRYLTKFQMGMIEDTIANKMFLDSVMMDACKIMCYKLKTSGKAQEEEDGEQ